MLKIIIFPKIKIQIFSHRNIKVFIYLYLIKSKSISETRSERGLDPKKCYYRGHEYEDRLTVEERTGCYKECFCRNFKTLNS